nr:lipocalin family protein [Epilithonimonas sp.]
MKKTFAKILLPISIGIIGILVLNSCSVGIPDKTVAVKNFDSDKYLGKWYEIARFDFKFERNLNQVTATYSKKSGWHNQSG